MSTSGFDLNRMISIAIDISAERDFDRLMQKILLEAMDVCHCDAGTVYMKEKDHLIFSTMFTKSQGLTIEEQNSRTMPPPVPLKRTHVCACAVIDNKKINIPDVYESKDYDFAGAQKYDAMTGYRTGSMLVIPMCDEKGEIIGVQPSILKSSCSFARRESSGSMREKHPCTLYLETIARIVSR